MKTFIWLRSLLLSCFFLAGACAPKPAFDPLSVAPGVSPDPEFSEAVSEAHETIGDFYAAYFSPQPTQTFAGLRVRFQVPGSELYEYHWTEFIDYYNGFFTVRLVDSVGLDMGQHAGHQVQVPEGDVVDWIVIQDDGTFIGGYTVWLAYERMTPEEKRQFIEVTGYIMD